jgi:hypothetical protein
MKKLFLSLIFIAVNANAFTFLTGEISKIDNGFEKYYYYSNSSTGNIPVKIIPLNEYVENVVKSTAEKTVKVRLIGTQVANLLYAYGAEILEKSVDE